MNSATMDSGQRFIEIVGDLVDPTHIISIEGSSTEHDGTDGIMIESDAYEIDHETVLPDDASDGGDQLVLDHNNQLVVSGNQISDYVTIKSNGVDHHHHHHHHQQEMGLGQVVLPDGIVNEMVVEQNIEVGSEEQSDDVSTGEIILVPNNYCFKQELMDANEVVVGANMHAQNVGNEIEIEEHDAYTSRHLELGLDDMDGSDDEYDDSALVIDTGGMKDDYNPITYSCGECSAVLKSRNSLQKHVKKYHAVQESEPEEVLNKTHNCPACPYHTPRRDKLDKHMCKHIREGYSITGKKRSKQTPPLRMRHTPEEYKCLLCPYKCTIEKSYKKHLKIHGGQGKQFMVKVSCKICGKDRPTEADLRKHMKKHKDGKDFLCDVCGFASIQMKKIIQHRRMHTGEKPHLCPHCSYRSARRDNLRSHVRRMHKKENMYIDTFNPRNNEAGGNNAAAFVVD